MTQYPQFILYDKGAGEGGVVAFNKESQMVMNVTNSGWRKSWDIIVTGDFLGSGRSDIVLYDKNAGEADYVSLNPNGSVRLDKTSQRWRKTWSIIVAGDFRGRGAQDLLLFDPAKNEIDLVGYASDGTVNFDKTLGNWGAWSSIVVGNFLGIAQEQALFYNAAEGKGRFVVFNADGTVKTDRTYTGWRHTWTNLVVGDFRGLYQDDLIFYEKSTGTGELLSFDASGGVVKDVIYNGWRKSWDSLVAGDFRGTGKDDLILYSRGDGEAGFLSFDAHANVSLRNTFTGWRHSWDIVVSSDYLLEGWGQSQLLLYDKNAGEADVVTISKDGKSVAKDTTSKGWRHVWNPIISLEHPLYHHRNRVLQIQSGLLAYYPLHNDANDYSGYSRNATLSNITFSTGLFGQAATFPGGNSSITLPSSLPPSAPHYTISLWVKPSASQNASTLLSSLTLLANHTVQYVFNYTSGGQAKQVTVTSTAVLSNESWHHVAVSYNHVTRQIGLFIDRFQDQKVNLSSSVGRSDVPTFPGVGKIGGPSVSISDVFLLNITSQRDVINFLGNTIQPINASAQALRGTSLHRTLAAFDVPSKSCVPAWWWVIPALGQIALYNAATCAASPPTVTSAEIVRRYYEAIRQPLNSDVPYSTRLERADLHINASVKVHIDVGGEGRKTDPTYNSGFADSINLNDSQYVSGQPHIPKYQIPNLIKIASWGHGYPFPDHFADRITMQNAQLLEEGVNEIARIIKPNGELQFWLDKSFNTNIQALADRLQGKVLWYDDDEFMGHAGSTKTSIILSYHHDEL